MESDVHPRASSPTGERESVMRTFLIADIRGYTHFSDTRGDEAAARLTERFVAISRQAVDANAGAIVEVRGDEILAVFDLARQAVRAAVDMQSAFSAEPVEGTALGVGVGIDAGEAVAFDAGYRGRALNMAARLCARAKPGEILVTPELAHLAGAIDGIRFEARARVRLKGISRPVGMVSVSRTSMAVDETATTPSGGNVEFHLLGPLGAVQDGRPVQLGGPRQRLVLAHLLLSANRVVSMEELVDRVWDGDPPQAARNTIQSYVSHLRAALGVDRIEGRVPGYVLHAEPEQLDVLRFEQLLRHARRQAATEPREAVATFGAALELWRGSPLSDLSDAPSLTGEIARLHELRLAALEDLLAARLAIGEHAEALPDLERITLQHPLRERLWAHLLLARYRSGRQADALEGYRRAQEILSEELGIDPSQELQDLHRRMLQQDPALQLSGRPLRSYRLLEQVGEGAFGIVWRGLDPELGREVAVKQIHPRLADDPSFVRRFEQEAQTIARLEHPHVVPLYDYWRDGTGAYLVMRWMRGGSLEDVIDRGRLTLEQTALVVDQVAAALSTAHRVRTVHRDVKPSNVLLDEHGNAYLADFGFALDLEATPDDLAPGMVGYRSPEEIRGEPASPRSDIYGLGMVVQDLLDGTRLEGGVADVLGRATADDPHARYEDAIDFAAALRDALGLSLRKASAQSAVEARNPYKGLRAFTEADADDFFGRDALVDRLVARMAEPTPGSRFLAVVGPSGSGKSSAVRAGLVPTLRRGALPGSERWFYVDMLPGGHPMEELEAALLRVAVDPPRSLLEKLEHDQDGLALTVPRLLPDPETELVLVIDQLEEVFTLVEHDTTREFFLTSLVSAVRDPAARLRVVVTLRADFYDRPLAHPGLAELMRLRSETVVPLTPEEFERAISGPVDRVGVVAERALVAEMVADVSDRPGALPLLQYALTELFERRRGGALTLEAYREIDGIAGALARRAEDLYEGLSETEREAAKQMFLRLVVPGEGRGDARRLVPRSELVNLQVPREAMHRVIEVFGRHRLLSFDRDPTNRGPTVEVAHEALLGSWDRLRIWIDEARDDLRHHRRLAAAAADWEASGRDQSFLLRGTRLEQLQTWQGSTGLVLSRDEQEYLGASGRQRDQERAEERARSDRVRALERRSLRRLRALVAALTAAALIAAGLTAVAINRTGEAERRRDEATVIGLTGAALSSLGTDPQNSLQLALYAVDESLSIGQSVPAETVEALHWAIQAAGIAYPVRDGPVVPVAGPFGTRGVFDLPVSDLANLAEAHVTDPLSEPLCQQFFGADACPTLRSFPIEIAAEPIRPARSPVPGQPLAGTQVLLGVFNPRGQEDLQSELDVFTEKTGIDVQLVEVPGFGAAPEGGARPDLGFTPAPNELAEAARSGALIDLSTYLDVEQLRRDQSPHLLSLGTVARDGTWPSTEGALYGAFTSVDVKNTVWYPVPEFREAGYTTPQTWNQLITLSDRMVADGRDPWCLGFLSQGSDGWPGTDWIESLLLSEAGPQAYDQWTFHQIPFDSAPVRAAFQRLETILFTDGYAHQVTGPQRYWDLAPTSMLEEDPPGCWLYRAPSFLAGILDPANVGNATDVFPLPAVKDAYHGAVIGGGNMVSAFADRPEVRELMRFFVSPEFGHEWAARENSSFISANRRFDLQNYQPFWRGPAKATYDALAADLFRFDASDLMPQEVGSGAFWEAMMTYLDQGPGSLDRILARVDAAWPAVG